MISTPKLTEIPSLLPHCVTTLYHRTVRAVNFSSRHHSRGLVTSISRQASPNLEACSAELQKTMGKVLPASEAQTEEAINAIRAGKVIAVPTDTLYGFACDACSAEAVQRIYEIKGRKLTSPLAICVADVSDISRFAAVDHLPHGLLNALLPGPVTVVLKRGDLSILEKSLNPGLESIGVRVPDSNFIRAITRGSGSALALTSANLSGQSSSVSIHDFEDLWLHCEYVYDGGLLPSGRAGSTVVDLIKPKIYKILRPGRIRSCLPIKGCDLLPKFGRLQLAQRQERWPPLLVDVSALLDLCYVLLLCARQRLLGLRRVEELYLQITRLV